MRRVRARGVCRRFVVLWMTLAVVSPGCGTSEVVEGDLGDEARKALVQKKVDVQQRQPGRNRLKTTKPKSSTQGQ